ncbi:DUF3611 family protein [Plectonema cf. radiosum LEGE 06105]|uniref:DUF3611 family protein n=1 Tax=Plectonema cf. radiosum LEGE 06105 TaxID=945769 RepID=A0A8J7FDS4_9CYAN|nr:DUF3611 family protein [Plectonema radiosum]MBE9212396.1 DUF3611 family protein [Plectonema cf. radiosum LEGE 06105]
MQSKTSLSSPSKQEFAGTFRLLGRISFWIHLVLGAVAGIILLLVMFSRNFSDINSPFIGLGIFLGVCGVIAVAFRIFWAYRYTRLAKRLQLADTNLHPKKEDIIRVLRVGLIISLIGIGLGFLATEETVIAVLAKTLAQPQGVAVYNPETVVRSVDLLLILADVTIIGAHFLGSVNSLGLVEWLDN